MKFTTLFLEAENVHLLKDIGMIPYIMYKEFGYDSTIACYKNGEYPYLDTEVKGLNINFIKKYTGKPVIDGAIYLLQNAKRIDVLHLFEFDKRATVCIWLYKLLNKNGKVYLKLDANYRIKASTSLCDNGWRAKLKNSTFKKCKLVSAETLNIYNFLKEKWKMNIEYIPNGFYDYGKKEIVSYDNKENIILTVGRIGCYQKATEVLLEGFKLASNKLENWKLRVVGPIEEEFKAYINIFMEKNPELKEKIEFTGAIYDRNKLEEEYRKAKIFCLTSRWEGFPLVFLDAIKYGCYIISSNFDAAYDITDNEKYGIMVDIDNSNQLSEGFVKVCNNQMIIKGNFNSINKFCYEKFYWPTICKNIYDFLDK